MSGRVRDGVLTKVSTDAHDGRSYWFLGARSFDEIDVSLPEFGTFFIALIVCEENEADRSQVEACANRLIGHGCASVCCWGDGCERIETDFDLAAVNIEMRDQVSLLTLPMTTSHCGEPLSEAFRFFCMCTHASHAQGLPRWPCNDWLAIVVGDHDDWKDEVWGYLAEPSSSFTEDD